jgi:hypothetical protein
MGLDQYGFVRQKDHAQAVEFYWRKHSRLQEFMQALWADTVDGEDGEEFNCRELTLTKDDLQDLQGQIAKGYEDYVSRGGFFGDTSGKTKPLRTTLNRMPSLCKLRWTH